MNAPHLELLSPDQRARLAAIEQSGLSHPGMRLIMEMLGIPKFCRSRACMRAKACVGATLQCVRDNKELLRSEVLEVVEEERDAGG